MSVVRFPMPDDMVEVENLCPMSLGPHDPVHRRGDGIEALADTHLEIKEGVQRAAMHEEICRALHTLLDLKVRVGKGLDAVTSAVHGVMRA